MTFGWIASPVDDEIGSVLDFAESTRDFATQLGGDFGGTVSQRSVAIDDSTQAVRHGHTFFLSFTRRVAHAVHQRHIGGGQEVGCGLDRFVYGRFLAVDERVRVFAFCRMV